ncbi:NAD(P)-binding domain-containing protein [Lentilactobacillus sp. G22-6]|uniref:NAD(P)/FAD-dependent oxidoreductase n=1 Tax=Lentilactobacillus dabitei TaxID=2831523 RepID=UPI001C27D9E0|nr:NAD(P)/FAD-dependent oxidoreductase [Lentilactobacillus dabitei]MBU9788842.1 NAD(P)-binding domain-containing protein [Lentilactobacillus dabitei]
MSAQVSVAIIGAGAAGIGFAATLKSYGFRDFVVLEKGEVGDTFTKWNPETHLISPSFTTNGFGFPDLNAVVPDTSPAYSEGNEHLSGIQYAHYLKELARKLELSVRTHTEVKLIRLLPDESYELKLSDDTILTAQYVFIAIGDYAYPYTPNIPGAAHGIHYANLKNYDELPVNGPQLIIGGNEAAFDVAIHLAKRNIHSYLFASDSSATSTNPDPSKRLSTYTSAGYQKYRSFIQLNEDKTVLAINKIDDEYRLLFRDGTLTKTNKRPIFATGFACYQSPLIANLFINYNDRPLLTKSDESTISPNVFLLGPQVQHGNVLLCYIYKYRQWFAPLAETVLQRIGIDINPKISDKYLQNGMYLKDYSACEVNC